MAETKKLTQKDYYLKIRERVIDDPELVAFIDSRIELLNKKNSNSSQSKVQKENEVIKEKIVASLRKIGSPVTISGLQELDDEMKLYSNQKLSALLKQLVDDDKKVVRTTDKKKSYFSVNA